MTQEQNSSFFGTRKNLDKHTIPSIKFGDSDIISSKNINFLGVILDPHLTFSDHITNKSKIGLYNQSLICKIRKFLTADQLKMLMCSLILTHLDNSNAILLILPDSISKQFQLPQNFMEKIMLNMRKQDSASEYLQELHWLPINSDLITNS